MTVQRKIRKVGGSVGVLIPRDIAEAMRVEPGSEVNLTLVNGQLVVEPTEGYAPMHVFRKAFAAVLRRDEQIFANLAAYDQER